MNRENIYKHTVSRARVRAHWQGVWSFCCHKCHRLLAKSLFFMLLWVIVEGNLTNGWDNRPKRTLNHREKHIFPRCFFFDFPEFSHFSIEFTPIFLPLCDTCDSKKQHCGWNARAHTRAREKRTEISPSFFLSFLFFSFLFFCFHFFFCTLFSSLFSQIVFSIEELFFVR